MDLDENELGYFITQVGLSAASFGVTTEDVKAVGEALGKLFAYRCAPASTVVPSQGPQLQSICQADTCPLSPNNTCSVYESTSEPAIANATLAGNTTSSTNSSHTASGTAKPTASTTGSDAASLVGISLTVVFAAAIFAVAL